MKLGVLFSGGKDSCYACYKAMQKNDVVCLITLISENKESYMFHTPNVWLTDMQAEAIGLPILKRTTAGRKEEELDDLTKAVLEAVKKYKIEGIVTGAVGSVYQSTRIQKICDDLGLQCVNPMWQADQLELLNDMIKSGFKIIISGVFAYPLDETFLGATIDHKMINKLAELQKRYKISPSGEGGEIETTVIDAPIFKKKIEITKSKKEYHVDSGVFRISEARLVDK